jgi:phospholipase C
MPTNQPAASPPPIPASFQKIQHFVVLMLENRAFDHLFGYLNTLDPRIAGLAGSESNLADPNNPSSARVQVSRATSFVMPFDPGHEFHDVQLQLYGPMPNPAPNLPPPANAPTSPAAMSGFVFSAAQAADFPGDADLVMQCFQPDQLPVLSTLAQQFAMFNFWYASLPGPTWPNRFFVHAATSGGLTDSPGTAQIMAGFDFKNGTIYDRLKSAGKNWRIYNDGMPQTAGINSLRAEYVNPFTKNFQAMANFQAQAGAGDLPEFTFIEPDYDTANNYTGGNSMHPLNDIRKGEALVKTVYDTLRQSPRWQDTMLIITFDEHGGFYDHQPPPATVPTGDDTKYANIAYSFSFAQLGVRVPAIIVSAYTQQGTVIGFDPKDPSTIFDHGSVLATVEKRFGLQPLTKRDAAANTLDVALNLDTARVAPPLPDPAPDTAVVGLVAGATAAAAAPTAPLSQNQQNMLDLALAVDLNVTDPKYHPALFTAHQQIQTQADAATYIHQVQQRVQARRR